MSATGQQNSLTKRVQYTSVSGADTTWNTPTGMADWALIIGAGSTVLVDEAGTSRTFVTDANLPNLSLAGPFQAFTSTTAAHVFMGNGGTPPSAPAVPASAVPATTAAVGGTTMSVAPASAATPIAVGTNDVRVTQVEVFIPLVLADGTFAESTVWIPGIISTIVAATLSFNAAVTQDDTNYLTFTLSNRDGAGGDASAVCSATSKTTGGLAFLGFIAHAFGAVSNAANTATNQITFKSVKSGTGQAVTAGATLRITYTVP